MRRLSRSLNNSDYMVNYNINNQACDNNTNKEINLLKNSKYFEPIDLYGSKPDISLSTSNMAAKIVWIIVIDYQF